MRKEFKISDYDFILTGKGRLTVYGFGKCIMQLQYKETKLLIEKLTKNLKGMDK